MTNIFINNRKSTIEITKAFEKKACVFNSDEYNELKAAKADFPTYRVRVKSAPKRKIEDRITLNDITNYVRKHCGDNSKEMQMLVELRGTSLKESDDIFEVEESAGFTEIKHWFFGVFPELADKTAKRKERIAEIVAGAAKSAAPV